MSDTPQGPEWWLASDGKWYPPESRPRPMPAPPPPPPSSDHQVGPGWWLASDGRWYPPAETTPRPGSPAPTASLSSGLSGTLQGFFWVAGVVSVLFVVLGMVGWDAFNRFWDARSGSATERRAAQDVQDADDAINGLLGLGGIVALVIFVLIIIWGNQAHRVTQQLWPGDRSWSSGWTIGGWFIPAANAVIPKLVFNEIERIATAPRSGGRVTPGWKQQPTSASGWVWWIFFVVGYTLAVVGGGMFDDPGGDADSWRLGYVFVAVGGAGLAVSSVAGALYIRRLTRALRSET